ncbi:MAG: rod shape-determining protein MreC, partial [Desulfovibrionales bacterium]
MRSSLSRIFWALLACLFLYLSMYTWNWRTGALDNFVERTGLEFAGWVLAPGKWTQARVTDLWTRYIALVHLSERNAELTDRVEKLQLELARLREEEAQNRRLRTLLSFSPPQGLTFHGSRIIGQKLGPNAVLETVLLDKGESRGVSPNTPVLTADGVVGRVFRTSAHFSSVLLLTDPNSRIAVISRTHRTPGILTGGGPDAPMKVLYIPLNAPLSEGDVLITSGLAGIFPKGLPAARITRIVRSSISLFQQVWAEPLVNIKT